VISSHFAPAVPPAAAVAAGLLTKNQRTALASTAVQASKVIIMREILKLNEEISKCELLSTEIRSSVTFNTTTYD